MALAIKPVLPKYADSERDATFVVVAVTGLSTIAMFLYPLVAGLAGLDDRGAGIFFGGTIHDVAQVVGAGYSSRARHPCCRGSPRPSRS